MLLSNVRNLFSPRKRVSGDFKKNTRRTAKMQSFFKKNVYEIFVDSIIKSATIFVK